MGPEKSYAQKEKLGRGRWMPRGGGKIARLQSMVRKVSRKIKIRFFIVMALIMMIILFYTTRKITFGLPEIMLTSNSFTLLLAEGQVSRGWKEIRDHSGCKPRRRCDGVERSSRMGHRTR
jgi:mannan polymerase II complex MNN10 subunit